MSIDAMAYVWKTPLKGSQKLMLLAIADRADEFGVCFPGVAKLAQKCGVTRRSAQKLIEKLVEIGELIVHVNDGTQTGSGKTNRYYMKRYRDSIGKETPVSELSGVESDTPSKNQAVSKVTSLGVSKVTPLGVSKVTPNTTEDTKDKTTDSADEPPPVQVIEVIEIPKQEDKSKVQIKLSPDEHNQFLELLNKEFKLYGARVWLIYHQLMGTAKSDGRNKDRHEYGQLFRDKPVSLSELQGFIKWYRVECSGCDLPIAAATLEDWFGKYRASQNKQTPARPGDAFFQRKMPVNINMINIIPDKAVS